MKTMLTVLGLLILTFPLSADLAPAETIYDENAYTGFHGSDAMIVPNENLRFVCTRFEGGYDHLIYRYGINDDSSSTIVDSLSGRHFDMPVLIDHGDVSIRVMVSKKPEYDVLSYFSWTAGLTFFDAATFASNVIVPVQVAGDSESQYILINQGRLFDLTEFELFYDTDESVTGYPVYFGGPDVLNGLVHSNSDIWVKQAGGGTNGGWPTFHSKVTTAGMIHSISGTIPWDEVFLGGYEEGVTPIQFSPTADEIREHGEYPLGHGEYDIAWIRLDGTEFHSRFAFIVEHPPDTLTVYDTYPPYASEPGVRLA